MEGWRLPRPAIAANVVSYQKCAKRICLQHGAVRALKVFQNPRATARDKKANW